MNREGDRLSHLFIVLGQRKSEQPRPSPRNSLKLWECLSTHCEDIVPKPYQEFRDIFAKASFDELPIRSNATSIKLVPNARNDAPKIPLAPSREETLDEFLNENLKTNVYAVKITNGIPKLFLHQKRRRKAYVWSKTTEAQHGDCKNTYPLPLIQDILNNVSEAKAKYFTKLDIRWGYNNIQIKEGDKWKAAFQTNRGLLELLVMFFGLMNSPATFQMMMNTSSRNSLTRSSDHLYDNILMFVARPRSTPQNCSASP